MTKKSKNVFGIFTESVGLYFSNFRNFMKYMTFPVLGQGLGLIIILVCAHIFSENLPNLLSKYPDLENFNSILILSALVALPGLIIFTKAFWDFLVAYGALNSMFENMQKSGRIYDFQAHTELIKRRSIPFIGLWLIWGLISILALCPFFVVICGIFAVYFVLTFQVFTFEPDLSPAGCFKKSLILVKGHFASTFLLIALVAALSYVLIPQLFVKCLELAKILPVITDITLPFFNKLPIIDLSQYGLGIFSGRDYANFGFQIFFTQIIIQYTLPLRSTLWALWYKELSRNCQSVQFGTKNSKSKRPSEKLMEKTKKKFSKKTKLDENILKRAAEKDDE